MQAGDAEADRAVYAYANGGVYVLRLRLHPRACINWQYSAAARVPQFGNRNGEGTALGNLGITYVHLRETAKAIEYHEQALIVSREIDDRCVEGIVLNSTCVV